MLVFAMLLVPWWVVGVLITLYVTVLDRQDREAEKKSSMLPGDGKR